MNKRILAFIIPCILFACKPPKPFIQCDISNLAKKDTGIANRSFTIKNTGNADLIVEDFVSGCECTSLGLKKNVHIAASDSIVVPVTITPNKNFSDKMKQVYVTVKTNADPRLTSFSFTYNNPYYVAK